MTAGGRPISPTRLLWSLSGRQIARGERPTVRNLPPGRRVIELRVRGDAKATARVTVAIRPVTPSFLRVSVPKRVASTTRFVKVRLRSSVAVTVASGAHRLELPKGTSRTLRIPIRPGHSEVWLSLSARVGRVDYAFTRTVRRR